MKTSELIGPALDWAVAKCEGRQWPDNAAKFLGEQYYNPSTNWAESGPIIEREKLGVVPYGDFWQASSFNGAGMTILSKHGPTPLIAAMRCYVASKLGDEIDIPEELK